MLTPRYIAGFTGHRSGYQESKVAPALKMVLSELQNRAATENGQMDLCASVAEGTDILCIEAARELQLPVHLILPLEEEDFAKDFASVDHWNRSLAQINISRQHPGSDSVRVASGEARRPECYFNQAMLMLRSCDVLVAVHDGQPSRGLGGTAQIIAQAQNTGIPVIIIDAASGSITWDEKVDQRLLADTRIEELNKMARDQHAPCADAAPNPTALQECLDHVAVAEAGRFRPSVVRLILIHGLAALLAAVATYQISDTHLSDRIKPTLAAVELLLVTAALLMTIRLHQRRTQERWIDCRFACELVRGLRASVPLVDPLDPLIARHYPDWRRFALSAGVFVQQNTTSTDPVELRDEYLRVRLGDSHAESQIRHYQKRSPAAIRWWKFTGWGGTWSARLAPGFVLVSLGNKLRHVWHPANDGLNHDPVWLWILASFLPIALPLMAGMSNGIRQALDAGRRSQRYPQMISRLLEMKRSLPGLETPSTIRAAVERNEDLLLNELVEWRMVAKNTGAH